ncbi:dynein regulatory complex subunit 7 [Aulostomus maculatus]
MATLQESESEEPARGEGSREEEEEPARGEGSREEEEEPARGEGSREEEEEPARGEGSREEEEEPAEFNFPVSTPCDFPTDERCPEPYRRNSSEEAQLLTIADNFLCQYSQLYPDRKPLLLCPVNECGVKKFVSTSLRPTATSHPNLHTWEGCASFVADFLSLEHLLPPDQLPGYLLSSTCVLQRQRATCVEFATLLCSLLLGTNYDAYCVSGYATKEMCLLDQSLQDGSHLATEVVTSEQLLQENKYTVKPLVEMKSRFVMQQEKKRQEVEQLQEQSPPSPEDPLWGLRVHCWVLVLSGSREIQENFFIDPLTGRSYSTTDKNFLGVESVWNHLNYYVNMQTWRSSFTDVVYDLDDLTLWEPVLHGAISRKQLKRKEMKMMSRINQGEEDEQTPCPGFEMPGSWVSYISISKKDLETCWPGGQKTTRYKKAQLETFAPYLRADGLVRQLTVYRDLECTEVIMVKEWYQQRSDHMEEREVNKVNNFTTERFARGRRFDLLFHRYKSHTADAERQMEFSTARIDGLVRREESPGEMMETFEGREDFLYYRYVTFDRNAKFPEPEGSSDLSDGPVMKVVERFHRNPKKEAKQDVAERVFLLAERRIRVTYHVEEGRVAPWGRSFTKPRESTELQKAEDFSADMVSSFLVDPSEKPVKTLRLYEELLSLMKVEQEVVLQVKESKKEVADIVSCREDEQRDVQLHFSPWTTTGASRARRQRQEMERLVAEEQKWLLEKEKDFLAPFLIRLGNVENVSTSDAQELYRCCLAAFKQRLVEQVNLIQERYQQETQELQRKQQWYQQNQLNMSRQQEAEYQAYCSEKTLRIQVAKTRLSMEKASAAQRYRALDQKLKLDPRLAPHLQG